MSILDDLSSQVSCYRRLAKLAEAQHDHVQQSRTDDLLIVLTRRQEVIDQIFTLEQSIAPAKKQWGEFVAGLTPDDRASAEALLSEAKLLLEQITTSDRADAMILQQRKLNLGKQINQTGAARQVNKTYAAAAYGKRPAGMDVQR